MKVNENIYAYMENVLWTPYVAYNLLFLIPCTVAMPQNVTQCALCFVNVEQLSGQHKWK